MNIILSTILVVSSMVLIVLGIVGFRHRGISGVKAITLLMFAMAIHSFAYGMELMSSDWETMYQWIRVEYLGVSFYPILILWFAREYAGERRFANNYVMGIVLAICTATLFLVQTNAMHGLYYAQMGVDGSIGFPIVVTQKGQWYMVQVGALYFAMIYALVVLTGQIINTRGVTRRRAILVFTGMLVPMIASTCYLLGWGIGEIDLIPFSFIFLSVLVASGIYRYDILFLSEVTHEMIFNTIGEGVIVVDSEGYILKMNRAMQSLFGILGQLKIGEPINRYMVLAHILESNASQTVAMGDKHYQIRLNAIGKHHGTIVVFTDVTEITEAKKQVEILAITDHLTQLYNRHHFVQRFNQLEKAGVVMLLDIDHFKLVNDQYGHQAGDTVLCELADCLSEHFYDGVICRYGGEEFAVLIEGESLENARNQGETFRAAFQSRQTDFPCTVSIGLCWYNKEDYSKTMNLVDKLLYQAKNAGRNAVVWEDALEI
ncbi:histidine kinase N-terminal 7TM domain-containing protein [Acetobacterium wieringae]|uniref:histidine kinase N-terminal 7TM domain-containing diguanylate cyclase n=1 Tax=Acetobacterium wieringae TaxID=52694 RepID=UPI0026F11633|nr:histidine kinase N-terminal 7TM domain-containing protein [Acetobacterium wieringae]